MEFLEVTRQGGRSGHDLLHLRDWFEIEVDFNGNVSCFIAVDTLMDNDLFYQAVLGGGVQFGNVGVFLNGVYPLAGVVFNLRFIGQLFSGLPPPALSVRPAPSVSCPA